MRFIETKKLNDFVAKAGGFFEEQNAANFSERLQALRCVSLQTFSIKHDRAFLREVASVLNVIVSIIHHPHISNKREEVIIRIEQAQQVGQEAFLDTLKDGKLWKRHNFKMIPEELHYHQYEDELRIYENRFIGFLVDVIDRELTKFNAFYLSRLPTLSSPKKALDSKQIGQVIAEIDRLKRKTQFIKDTHFYREVTKGKPISSKIQPTNILLKDRLYRFCFRFYKSIARYEDVNAAKSDLRSYYMILLFKELYRRDFVLSRLGGGEYVFEHSDFVITLTQAEKYALRAQILCRGISDTPSGHILGFYTESEQENADAALDASGAEGAEMISLWKICYADGGKLSNVRQGSEKELIRGWLTSKITKIASDRSIYEKYCPICRNRGVDNVQGVYICPSCDSRYMFDSESEEGTVWFRKIRRR